MFQIRYNEGQSVSVHYPLPFLVASNSFVTLLPIMLFKHDGDQKSIANRVEDMSPVSLMTPQARIRSHSPDDTSQ